MMLTHLIQESLPKTWSLLRPRQKCSAMWNISIGLSRLPTFAHKHDYTPEKSDSLSDRFPHGAHHWLLVDDEIYIDIGVDEVSVRGPANGALDAHQTVLLSPATIQIAHKKRNTIIKERGKQRDTEKYREITFSQLNYFQSYRVRTALGSSMPVPEFLLFVRIQQMSSHLGRVSRGGQSAG